MTPLTFQTTYAIIKTQSCFGRGSSLFLTVCWLQNYELEAEQLSEIVRTGQCPIEKKIIPDSLAIVTNNAIYQGLLSFAELIKLPKDLQESYILFLNRIGVNDSAKLSKVLGISIASAEEIAKKYELFDGQIDPDAVAKVQDDFEDSVLKGRKMAIINLKSAVLKAQSMTGGYSAGYVERAVKEMLKTCASTMSEGPLPKEAIEKARKIVEQRKGEKKGMKGKHKTQELYGLERVIGKVYTDIDENDFEKGITGCPIGPIYDEEKFLNDESYLRELFTYFPHVPTSLIAQCLFNKGCGCTIFTKIQKRISELGINQQVVKKEDSLYEQAIFVGWAAKDPYKGIEFVYEYNKKHGKAKPKTPDAKPAKTAPVKEENSNKEEKPMTKKTVSTPANTINLAETVKSTEPTNQTDSISVKLTGNVAYIFRKLADFIDDGIKVDIIK